MESFTWINKIFKFPIHLMHEKPQKFPLLKPYGNTLSSFWVYSLKTCPETWMYINWLAKKLNESEPSKLFPERERYSRNARRAIRNEGMFPVRELSQWLSVRSDGKLSGRISASTKYKNMIQDLCAIVRQLYFTKKINLEHRNTIQINHKKSL